MRLLIFEDRGVPLHVLYCYGDVRAGSESVGNAEAEDWTARGRLRAQIDAGLTVLGLRQLRATPADLAAIPDQLAAWRAKFPST